MKPIKFTWEEDDTFDTIHKKLKKIVGQQVINPQKESVFNTIFAVSDIEEKQIESLGGGFISFLDGDQKYTSKDGGYNFEGMTYTPVWMFGVDIGREDENGNRVTKTNNLSILRTDKGYEIDKSQIVVVSRSPFIHYPKEWL